MNKANFKKWICLSLIIAGIDMAIVSCNSDDNSRTDFMTKEDPTINEVSITHGDQIVKTVINHPGIIHYDSELNLWYIDYIRNKPVGFKEKHYTDSRFQEEGIYVVFSGDVFDFSPNKAETSSSESDFYISLREIDRCEHLQPLSETATDIAEFFDAATLSDEGLNCQFIFPEETMEERFSDTCYVINDQAQLASLYTGQMTIPAIDFTKYTLVIGRVYIPSTRQSLEYFDVSFDDKTLYLYIEEIASGLDVISLDYYWGLFPKFEGNNLVCLRNITKKY